MTARSFRNGSRRAFVQALLAAAALPVVRDAQAASLTNVEGGATLAEAIADMVRDIEVSQVGKAYLVVQPSESSMDRLISEIERAALDDYRGFDPPSTHELGLALANAVRQDFQCGRIVNVRGWRLSQTEARVCALAHLAHTTQLG
jgi:hypothetical protein